MPMKIRELRLAAQIAFTYIGTVVGAGFASGQEILQFFTRFGHKGYFGIAVSTFLFAWVGLRMLMLGYQLRATSYRQLTAFLFGQKLAGLIDTLMMVMLFGVTVAMLAGVGALFEENSQIPFHIGVLLTMALTFFTILRGMKGILAANSFIVPTMLLVISFLFVHAIIHGGSPREFTGSETSTTLQWLASAVSYASFNMGLAVSVLVPLGEEVPHPKVLKWGAVLGALGLGMMLVGAQYAMSTRLPEILSFEIPMAYVTSLYGRTFQLLFLFVLWAEIYSTLIANVFGLGTQLASPRRPVHGALVTILILTSAFFVAQVGFSNIVNYLYPIFGYVSFLLLLLLLWPRKYPQRPTGD
jgi:uncharacterized membrane protein YkvI